MNFTLTIQRKQQSLNVAFICQKRILEKKLFNDQRRKTSYTRYFSYLEQFRYNTGPLHL